MDGNRLKFIVIIGGFVVAIGLLIAAGMRQPGGFAYYLSVSEFLQDPARHADGYRVNGKVRSGSIERLPSGQDLRFVMTDGAGSLPVVYHGIIPDTFVDDADVVVEGRLRPEGTFEAHTLLAKCPSKYESAEGQTSDAPALQRTTTY